MTTPGAKSVIVRVFTILCFVFGLSVSEPGYAIEFGFSSSSRDISIDVWMQNPGASRWGGYSRLIFDFDQYQNGSLVSVCKDGTISGTIGSGACSGHSGVSNTKLAEFDRLAVALGASYWVVNSIQLHSGILVGTYSSDINVGDKGKLDYTKVGLEFGLSWKMFSDSNFKILLSHETEMSMNSVGIWFPITF